MGALSHRHIWPKYLMLIFPFTGFMIGYKLEKAEALRLTKFRDKSALYGRELKPGEPPSWPY
ncbi:NADH dehydrogenase [ubiquinone] 1 beta subcomplex subunit 1 [Pseudomyrmex gracilis]|uniref:NADH dehydrogenase [ubiquinone] 1 beta subcomplex subunit 1 n=1 Tax=Pseudomyrmex gracilis TaxID=219809 RepID=UPI0009959227|nr:NADH dehydrogenase [ubiquinone] 1 beta subcomplex subunit 1 [Pseudomyrmex gracilis]XP_020298698.1 NADH dehydrogenase [ubiquinone] 1 beta subcomplex subunit 1 [Pseudomyrmex gracilis]XP_020298699.1 NADH dehydrogenase [ubiquinone] 1 beta subcomplex subunit 1 [Pseudomyrmex gracilis]